MLNQHVWSKYSFHIEVFNDIIIVTIKCTWFNQITVNRKTLTNKTFSTAISLN
jgi:hypothetical protein